MWDDVSVAITHTISKKRLIVALICGAVVLYIGMSHMLPVRLPLPEIIDDRYNPLNFALIQLIFTIPVLICGRNFFINGTKNLVKLHPNMDSLVMIGTTTRLSVQPVQHLDHRAGQRARRAQPLL